MTSSRTACLVVAAGSGLRLGAGRPKAFVEVAGRTLLDRAVDAVTASGSVDLLVLVVPSALVAAVSGDHAGALVVAGGATRQESVAAGVAVLDPGVDVVLVHDAARAFTPPAVFDAVVAAVRAGHPAVVPAVALHDTVRAVSPVGGGGTGPTSVLVDRSALRAVQTPQGFERTALEGAHRRPGAVTSTDDATMVERLGHPVHLVEGSARSFKVTGPLDLLLAAALAAAPAASGSGAAGGGPP